MDCKKNEQRLITMLVAKYLTVLSMQQQQKTTLKQQQVLLLTCNNMIHRVYNFNVGF